MVSPSVKRRNMSNEDRLRCEAPNCRSLNVFSLTVKDLHKCYDCGHIFGRHSERFNLDIRINMDINAAFKRLFIDAE